jgi:hypothetical protein
MSRSKRKSSQPHLDASTKYVHQGLILVSLWKAVNDRVPKSSPCFATISILRAFDLACPLVGLTISPHDIHAITKRADILPHGLPISVSIQHSHKTQIATHLRYRHRGRSEWIECDPLISWGGSIIMEVGECSAVLRNFIINAWPAAIYSL